MAGARSRPISRAFSSGCGAPPGTGNIAKHLLQAAGIAAHLTDPGRGAFYLLKTGVPS
jgi:hypothetical protein